jgi:hypothetical protein
MNELIKLYKELRSKSNFVEDELIEFCLDNDIHPCMAADLKGASDLLSSEIIFLQHVVGNLDY